MRELQRFSKAKVGVVSTSNVHTLDERCDGQPTNVRRTNQPSGVYRIAQKLPQAPQSPPFRGQGRPLQRRGARCNEGLLAASRQTYRPFPAWAASSGYRLVQRLPCCATVRPSSVRPLDGFAGVALIERLRRMAGISPALLTSLDIKTVRLRRMSASPGRSAARPWLSERRMWADHVHRAILAVLVRSTGEPSPEPSEENWQVG